MLRFVGKHTLKSPYYLIMGVGTYQVFSFLFSYTYLPEQFKRYTTDDIGVRYEANQSGGTYAVVTGASSPTGQAFCERLSKEGFRLVLVDDC